MQRNRFTQISSPWLQESEQEATEVTYPNRHTDLQNHHSITVR